MLDRRHFLTAATTGLAASLALRGICSRSLKRFRRLPDHSLLDKNEDAYWAECGNSF